MRVSRLWRDIQTRKRFGFGHEESGEPGKGGLALFCPACPQPGVNLPKDWKDSAEPYALLIELENLSHFLQLALLPKHCC
jgi:hypothetical protein